MLKRKIHVFIVSDATGITAERVIKAALVQFIEIESIYEKFPYIQATDQIDTIFAKAEKHDAIIIYSLVSWESPELQKLQRAYTYHAITT